MINSLEQTIEDKINAAKETVQQKLFKQWMAAKDDAEAAKVRASKDALDAMCFELIKGIRKGM